MGSNTLQKCYGSLEERFTRTLVKKKGILAVFQDHLKYAGYSEPVVVQREMMGFQRIDAKGRILEIGRRLKSTPDLTNTYLLLLCFGHPQYPPVETMGERGPLYHL